MSEYTLDVLPTGYLGRRWAVSFRGEYQGLGVIEELPTGEYLATGRFKPVSSRDVAVVQLIDSAIARNKREIARLTEAKRLLLAGEVS